MVWLLLAYPGIFLISDDLKEVKYKLFGNEKPEISRAVEAIISIEEGKLIDELKEVLSDVKEVKIDSTFIGAILKREYPNISYTVVESGEELLRVRERLHEELLKIFGSYEEYVKFATAVGIEVAKHRVKKAGERKDLMIIRAVTISEDLTKMINTLVSHVREWYGYHFPELGKIVDDHELYLKLIVELGHRDNFTEENLRKVLKNEKLIKEIAKAREESVGIDITDDDIAMIQHFAKRTLDLYEDKRKVLKYLDDLMMETAPNIRALVGSVIGAKLIRKAGGLAELAKMPASTIQILGAEKALFRALAGKGTPPKHGIIFQDPRIFKSPWWQRGKIARALAGKLAIAARVDYFSGEYIGDELLKELEGRIEEIKKKYPKPPPRAKKPGARPGKPARRARKKGKKKGKKR